MHVCVFPHQACIFRLCSWLPSCVPRPYSFAKRLKAAVLFPIQFGFPFRRPHSRGGGTEGTAQGSPSGRKSSAVIPTAFETFLCSLRTAHHCLHFTTENNPSQYKPSIFISFFSRLFTKKRVGFKKE